MDRKKLDSVFNGMISEDRSAMANMPQEVVMKQYPKCEYMNYDLDDTIKGVDNTINDSVRTTSKHKSKSMY